MTHSGPRQRQLDRDRFTLTVFPLALTRKRPERFSLIVILRHLTRTWSLLYSNEIPDPQGQRRMYVLPYLSIPIPQDTFNSIDFDLRECASMHNHIS